MVLLLSFMEQFDSFRFITGGGRGKNELRNPRKGDTEVPDLQRKPHAHRRSNRNIRDR